MAQTDGIENTNRILNDISAIRDEFYSSNPKNIFFTSSQKKECADYVSSKISLESLIQGTIYLIQPNLIFVDYTLLKQYACDTNYHIVLTYLFDQIHRVLEQNTDYELHINFQGFSVSAVERHKDFIKLFYKTFFQDGTNYLSQLKMIYIYYVPSMMSTIVSILSKYMKEIVGQKITIRDKVVMISKEESPEKLSKLYACRFVESNHKCA